MVFALIFVVVCVSMKWDRLDIAREMAAAKVMNITVSEWCFDGGRPFVRWLLLFGTMILKTELLFIFYSPRIINFAKNSIFVRARELQ